MTKSKGMGSTAASQGILPGRQSSFYQAEPVHTPASPQGEAYTITLTLDWDHLGQSPNTHVTGGTKEALTVPMGPVKTYSHQGGMFGTGCFELFMRCSVYGAH